MSRDWIGVYARLVRLPKFRRLSDAGQLTLIYVWLLAGDTEPEATWPDRDTLGDLLELNGRTPDALAELVDRRWLDVADGGTVTVHDWDEWQYAASQAGRRAWEARYMREWRKRPPKAPRAIPDLTVPDLTRHDMTGVTNSSLPVNNNGVETGDAWEGWDPKWTAVREALEGRGFRLPPTIRQREMLWPIVDARPNDVAAWVTSAPAGTKASDVFAFVLRKWQTVAAAS